MSCPEKQGPMGPGENGELVRPRRPLSLLPNFATKISSGFRSPFREMCLVKVSQQWLHLGKGGASAQKENPGSVGTPALRGAGRPSEAMHFYRSKHDHHRYPKAWGCPIQKDWRKVLGPRGRCGVTGAPTASSTALSLHSSAW